MITINERGDFSNLEEFIAHRSARRARIYQLLNKYGEIGVAALSVATPAATGLTAASWSYEIEETSGGYRIIFNNSHIINGVPIAVILQHGHATRQGGWFAGIDYINPAISSLLEEMGDRLLEECAK